MTVIREYSINEIGLKDSFASQQNMSDASLPVNTLLQGATLRTATAYGRSATVKAGLMSSPALTVEERP